MRVKYLPGQWTEDPEKAQRTLKDLLEIRAHLAVSQVVIKRTHLYHPKEGTEQQSFAHVWLYITAAHNKLLEDISTLTIQGKSLTAAWYPTQHEEQTPDEGYGDDAQKHSYVGRIGYHRCASRILLPWQRLYLNRH